MPTPFEHLASFDKLVHEPARLAILAALSACEQADFIFLKNLTGPISFTGTGETDPKSIDRR